MIIIVGMVFIKNFMCACDLVRGHIFFVKILVGERLIYRTGGNYK